MKLKRKATETMDTMRQILSAELENVSEATRQDKTQNPNLVTMALFLKFQKNSDKHSTERASLIEGLAMKIV